MSTDSAVVQHSALRILGPRFSNWLRAYYTARDHRAKLRLWRLMRKAMGFPRLTIPYSINGSISVDERDYLQNLILITGDYEPEVWETLSRFITTNEVFWDVGANIGSVAIKALLHSGVSEVHAFEPDPMHAEILEQNLRLNGARWALHRLALSNLREQRTLRHAAFPHGGGSTLDSNPVYDRFDGSYAVECWPADDLIKEKGVAMPTIVKVDIEGWEMNFLLGAAEMMKQVPPKAIVIELDSDMEGNVMNTEVPQKLKRLGYRVQWIRRPEGAVHHRENYLAYRT